MSEQPLDDRSGKEPITWRCRNQACVPIGARKPYYEFINDTGICPKCSAEWGRDTQDLAIKPGVSGAVVTACVLVHFLKKDSKGPIKGKHGNYAFACDSKRDHLATPTNMEAASTEPTAVNCPSCLQQIKQLGLMPSGRVKQMRPIPGAKP